MRWAEHVAWMVEGRGLYRFFVGKPEARRPLGKPRHRWENNIRDGSSGCVCANWIYLAQDRDRWCVLVNAVMNLQVPLIDGNFLTSCRPVSFSIRTAACSK
jgi:hypothetical protein